MAKFRFRIFLPSGESMASSNEELAKEFAEWLSIKRQCYVFVADHVHGLKENKVICEFLRGNKLE